MKKLQLEELKRLSVEEFHQVAKIPVCILLDNVRSLHNVGSVFRTADAFRLESVILTGITGTPPHREIHKTALGATDSVVWHYVKDPEHAVINLRKEGYKIVIIEQTTESIPLQALRVEKQEKLCLVFGNEVNGVSEQVIRHADTAVEIPQGGTKHSLNISVCAGIVSWEIFKQVGLSVVLPLFFI